ncbi:Voltage-dependent calcium channel subunit alpha-2/delta-4 [Larimichthys crocea]|uniref:Uncharacterized protein n=1 Tax=Larimichthys crocea TaxID=215358 RepID=A0ACD3Q7A9_LARCR|nr:Voltage-dependent calcium channel subunit alpha-2/delta-4 [Larimichthys crocea]
MGCRWSITTITICSIITSHITTIIIINSNSFNQTQSKDFSKLSHLLPLSPPSPLPLHCVAPALQLCSKTPISLPSPLLWILCHVPTFKHNKASSCFSAYLNLRQKHSLAARLTSQMPGVVSPHELLQKLQLVQQEQSLTSHDSPRLCPGLAPRFLGPTQGQAAVSAPNQTATTAGQKAAMQFQVISPQRIPATVAPNLLLSPSVFTQAKSSGGLSTVSQESCPAPSTLSRHPLQDEIRGLSRSQFQATLLHLIQHPVNPKEGVWRREVDDGRRRSRIIRCRNMARLRCESCSLCLMVDGQMKISPETVQQWAVSFGKEITALSARYSGAKLLQKKFKDIEGVVKMVEVDGEELVKKFAEEMEEMLGRKMKSVKRLAEAAEDADLYHEYNETLEFDYFNSLLINTVDEDGNPVPLGGEFQLEENEHFNKLRVNTDQSNIQVPTNVYNKDPDILNGAYMSEALNDVFTENFRKDPTLTWQYFGSATGFFRLYPGSYTSESHGSSGLQDENGVVTFDCRNRNWYIQAATSPKDVVIVVDVSGSMKGLRLTIAKHTINTILDTLGENDFVNVIAHFKLLVDELHVKGEGRVKNAMKESFKILNEAAAQGQGSLCNQAIMLITDGAMEDFQDVFEEFNWPERRVRVFTYLIGREMTFAENVKWIACNNKGYYTHVSTLADVQENVMEYLHVLSRPMVINHDHDIIWTEAYMDSVLFNTQAQSLLLMTSVAMPVFSKKKETLSHGILLGVVGN